MRRGLVLILGAAIALLVLLQSREGEQERAEPAFAGSESCRECHEAEYAAWRGSHHDLAMQHATQETVLGDFDDASYEHGGTTYRRHSSSRAASRRVAAKLE